MATLTVDSWALHRLTLDFADQFVPGTLIANAADAHGRGIDLYVTDNGEAVSMTDMRVYLLWRHSNGNQGQTEFTAVAASSGHYKVYYPAGMMYEGIVTARISIFIGSTTPITGSRDFRINVERNPIDEGEAMADDDFSVFVQATIDLNTLNASVTAAEAARVTAENGRASAEGTRVSNENTRKSNETSRVSAESARVSAESGRASAESSRVTAEQGRVTEFARLKQESESATEEALNAAEDARGAVSESMRFVIGVREFHDGTQRIVLIDHGEE